MTKVKKKPFLSNKTSLEGSRNIKKLFLISTQLTEQRRLCSYSGTNCTLNLHVTRFVLENASQSSPILLKMCNDALIDFNAAVNKLFVVTFQGVLKFWQFINIIKCFRQGSVADRALLISNILRLICFYYLFYFYLNTCLWLFQTGIMAIFIKINERKG